ncbi:N-acetyltransferase family protein [Agrobacterium sp. 22-211-1]|uniref:GNAT family N-acetyltransferase n=1 Tax=Agrobacterium tomkonis TaxID=1183410 RepID=UPI001CD98DA3|nr:GNAT family N-acetyltransferase [Agrobacterium tomkonis RTP8]
MAAVQNEIFSAGLRKAPTDITAVLENYIQHADRIECSVAEDEDGRILGFQSLRYAREDNPYDVAQGWGIIGTHVSPQAVRRGVGSALFAATCRVAEARGLQNIDASIGADNMLGQRYYEAMGFTTYRQPEGLVCKVYRLG